jgi:hypothetical protein
MRMNRKGGEGNALGNDHIRSTAMGFRYASHAAGKSQWFPREGRRFEGDPRSPGGEHLISDREARAERRGFGGAARADMSIHNDTDSRDSENRRISRITPGSATLEE